MSKLSYCIFWVKGLRARVIIIQSLVVSITLILMVMVFYPMQKAALIEQFIDEARLTGYAIKNQVKMFKLNGLSDADLSEMASISPLFSSIELVSNRDQTRITRITNNFPPKFSRKFVESLHSCKSDFINMPYMHLVYTTPVYNDSNTCVNLLITSNSTFLNRKLLLIIEVLGACIFFNFFVITIIAWFMLDRYTVMPLRRLEQAVEGVSRGDYPKIKDMPNVSELHEISNAFNTMSSIIQAKEKSLKDTIKELKETQALIIKKERLATIGSFSSGISHEIGNPLSAIISMLETVKSYMTLDKKNIDDQDLKKRIDMHLDMINRSLNEAYRIDALIKQLLLYVRQRPVIVNNVNIKALVDDVITSVGSSRELKDIKVLLNVKPDMVFKTDYEKLRQILLNLVTNAVDAMNGTGTLTISADVKNQHLMLEVTDTGEGMDEQTIERIFEPFFTTKGAGKGTGLGLAIVKNLVQELGGEISVDSKKGAGSTFRVRLS